MTTTRKQENVTGSSQEVVATSPQSVLEQQNHSTQVISVGGRSSPRAGIDTVTGRRTSNELAKSLMPRRVKLNEPLTKDFVTGLEKAGDSAASEASIKRLRPDIPTADLVRRSGFKTGAKLLIKIVPSATSTPFEDGKNDIIAAFGMEAGGSTFQGTLAWYEYPNWTKYTIGNPSDLEYVADITTADLDGDGDLDLIFPDSKNNEYVRVYFYENPFGH